MTGHRPPSDARRALGAIALALGLLGAMAGSTAAQEPAMEIDWAKVAPASGHVLDDAAEVTAGPAGGTFPLIAVQAPSLGTIGYELRGQVRHRDVAGIAYLEMWSVFADGSRYFSRTVAQTGPQAALTGTSDWRAFELPFYLNGTPSPPRLEINVVMPGPGTVDVGRLTLVRLDSAPGGLRPDQVVGLLGAVVGTTIGILGGLIGWLVARRRARTFVIAAMTVISALGVAFIGGGIVAAIAGQPWGVVALLVIPGALMATVFRAGLPAARRAYAEAELRRMRAMDTP
jgi:hypothetical protein